MANSWMTIFLNSLDVYKQLCQSVCDDAGILQGELNVLLFLANNPDKNTAMDIYKHAGMKQSILSTRIEKMVKEGYLVREPIPGDRRKIKLVCTEKAEPVIRIGRETQKRFMELLTDGIPKDDLSVCARVMKLMEQNLFECREKALKGELK